MKCYNNVYCLLIIALNYSAQNNARMTRSSFLDFKINCDYYPPLAFETTPMRLIQEMEELYQGLPEINKAEGMQGTWE